MGKWIRRPLFSLHPTARSGRIRVVDRQRSIMRGLLKESRLGRFIPIPNSHHHVFGSCSPLHVMGSPINRALDGDPPDNPLEPPWHALEPPASGVTGSSHQSVPKTICQGVRRPRLMSSIDSRQFVPLLPKSRAHGTAGAYYGHRLRVPRHDSSWISRSRAKSCSSLHPPFFERPRARYLE